MENLNHFDEIFGVPLDEALKESMKNANAGWKIVLVIGLVTAAGVVTYHFVKSQQQAEKK